jgi:hypothetical protein
MSILDLKYVTIVFLIIHGKFQSSFLSLLEERNERNITVVT